MRKITPFILTAVFLYPALASAEDLHLRPTGATPYVATDYLALSSGGVWNKVIATILNPCSATLAGTVPTPPNDATKFLNGQCAWAVPPGGGGGGSWGIVGTSVVSGGVSGKVLLDNGGLLGELALGPLATVAPGGGVATWIITPTAANFAAALVGPVTVGAGGTGATTLTANALPKGNGSSAYSASALSDDGTKISASEPIDLTTKPLEVEIANAGSTGTTLNKLAKLTGAPATAVITAITDVDGAVGVVNGNAGTTSNARIAVSGQVNCVFDSATTAGNFVGNSPTIAGDCRDLGATRPSATQTIGRVLTTNASAGTYAVVLDRNFTNSGVITGFGVDNGATTPATVTTTGTTAATTRREMIGTLSASITRTLPSIGLAGLAVDSMVCYDDAGVNVTPTHQLTILPNAADSINGGTAGTGLPAWTSLTENCFRVAGTHNWVQADGVPTSTAPAGSVADGLDVNGLVYHTLTSIMDAALGAVQGSVIYRGASAWTALGPGTSGQVLQSAGAAANPAWATPSSAVSITAATPNIVATPSPLTGTGTIGTTLLHNAPADGGSHSYTVLSSDLTKEVDLVSTFTAMPVPQATGSFGAGAAFSACNAGAVQATSTTSTINGIAGATGIKLPANSCSDWSSDGTNWKVLPGTPIGTAAGQLLIWDATNKGWVPALLTAGSNVTLTPADGAITIAASGAGLTCPAGFTASGADCKWTQATSSGTDIQWTGLVNDNYELKCYGNTFGSDTVVYIQFGEGSTTWKTANYSYATLSDSVAGISTHGESASDSGIYVGTTTSLQNLQVNFTGLSQTTTHGISGLSTFTSSVSKYLFFLSGWYDGDTTAITAIRMHTLNALTGGSCTLYYRAN